MQTREMWKNSKWKMVAGAATLSALGISGLALAITHWLWSEGPKWARVAVARTPGARPAAGVSEFLCLRRVEELVHGVDRRLATNERRGGQVDS